MAGSGHFGHMMFYGQLTVYMEAEVADDSGRLDLGGTDFGLNHLSWVSWLG